MLVLSRKPGQKLQIGDNITITVLESKGNVLKIGIEAPRDIRVLRGELQAHPRETDRSRELILVG